ncbi:MAG: aminotransferase class IV, partial [Vicinamibacteria bacterium]|nr:aminotransferase class IV [Vicinamibacteria bacterium]
EGASSNVFFFKAGLLRTPPLEAGILAGITRAVVLELAESLGIKISAEPVRVEELLCADEAFITSSLREVMPVRAINGQAVGSGAPGSLTLRLLQAFRQYAPRHCAPSLLQT